MTLSTGLEKPKGTPPTFKEKPKVNQQDKNLVVECSCNASPKPTLTWYKDSKVLMQGPRYKMRSTDKGNDYTFYLDILVSAGRYLARNYPLAYFVMLNFDSWNCPGFALTSLRYPKIWDIRVQLYLEMVVCFSQTSFTTSIVPVFYTLYLCWRYQV